MTELTTSNTPRIRTLKACNQCRQRKVKCDGSSQCSNCIKYSVCCVYDPMPSKRVGRKKGVKPLKKKNATSPSNRINKVEPTKQKKQVVTKNNSLPATARRSTRVAMENLNILPIYVSDQLNRSGQNLQKNTPGSPESENALNKQSFSGMLQNLSLLDLEESLDYEMKLSDSIGKICEAIDTMSEKHGIPELTLISKEFLLLLLAQENKVSNLTVNDKLLNLVNQKIPLLLKHVDSALNLKNDSTFIASPLTSISSMNTYKDYTQDEDKINFGDEYPQISIEENKYFSPSQTTDGANIESFNNCGNNINNDIIMDNLEDSMFVRNDFNNTSANTGNAEELVADTCFSMVSMFFNNELPMEFNDSLMIA